MAGRRSGQKLGVMPSLLGPVRMERVSAPPKKADPFYESSEWRSLRDTLLKRRGRRCERCGKTHEDDGAPVKLIGDHKAERRDGGPDLDPANVEFLCVAEGGDGRPHPDGRRGGCHNRKTAEARARRMGLRP